MTRLFCILLSSLIAPLIAASPVHDDHLDNGLQVIVKPDRRAPLVVAQVWYKVGSSYEETGSTGLSHVL